MLRSPVPSFRTEAVIYADSVAQLLLETHIVVCKFAHLSIVHAEYLGLFRDAQGQPWNEMHDPENDRLMIEEEINDRG